MKLQALLLAVCGLFTLGTCADAGTVTFTRIGSPTWEPVDPDLFAAPIGTLATGYSQFYQTQAAILPPPHYVLNTSIGEIVPGTPEAGPYTSDLSNGIHALGYKQGPDFNVSDFSNGSGIWVTFMIVPSAGAPTGSSPDFMSGPIIPNLQFPLIQSGLTMRNGVAFDAAWSGQYTDVNQLLGLPKSTYAGFSHAPIFLAESSDFGPAGVHPDGHYTSTWSFVDSTGNGWDVSTAYTVPLPTAVWAGLPTLLLIGLARRSLSSKRVVG